MKKIQLVIVFFSLLCLSCQRGRPARKEFVPNLISLPEIGATVTPYPSRFSLSATSRFTSIYLFFSTDTSLLMNGMRQDLLVLAIPDPSHDSAIGAMVASGESLAPFLLNKLHQDNKAGIVIDLRLADNTPTIRQDYLITSTAFQTMNLPVIVLWDGLSASRAAFYTRYIQQFSGISWSITNGRTASGQADCFKNVKPRFQ